MTDQSPPGNSFRAAVLSGKRPSLIVEEKHARLEGDGEALEGGMIPRAEARTADHRDSDRHRLNEEHAFAHHDGKRREIELVNLSGGGAMIRGELGAKLWDVIELELGEGARLEAVVRWVKGDLAGLEFAHETQIDCDPQQRAQLLLEVIQRSFPNCGIGIAVPDAPERPEPVEETVERLGDRSEARHPLVWGGQILFAFDANPVRLRNISSSGALVDVSVPYPIGAEVMLDLGEAGQLDCIVTWAKGEQAGLKFVQPYDLDRLAALKPDLTPYRWQRPGFLDRSMEDSTPWDEQWSRRSVADLKDELESFLKH